MGNGLLRLSSSGAFGQRSKQKFFFSDIDNLWVAYNSIRTTTDSLQQFRRINELYIAEGTPGLKAFVEVREYTAQEWVELIRRYPKDRASPRPHTRRAWPGAQDSTLTCGN